MASTCRAVAFDMDGLLFNTEELYVEVVDQILRRRGKQRTQDLIDQMMGRPTPLALQYMIDFHSLDATVDQIKNESDALFPDLIATRLAPMSGADELLQAVQEFEIPRAIATSSRRHIVQLIMDQIGWESRFDFILTAEDIVHGKPSPDIYLLAAERLSVSPNQLLVLEDSRLGCQAAVAAGTFAVAIPGEHSRHQEFPPVQFVADDLNDPRIRQALGLPV